MRFAKDWKSQKYDTTFLSDEASCALLAFVLLKTLYHLLGIETKTRTSYTCEFTPQNKMDGVSGNGASEGRDKMQRKKCARCHSIPMQTEEIA